MDKPVPIDARLSRYRLERLLGSGGMGSVYLAYDQPLQRRVAIKFISPEKSADDAARRRLVREARAAAALEHPNICAVYEVIDEPGGPPCIVMQYVEGETLASLLRSGCLDVRFALNIAADVASALSAAHKRRIIHRDIKPQNIIVTPDGRGKLVDFGIAADYGDPIDATPDATTSSRLTETGDVPGTPAYMSPEQVQGRPLDGRSDLFALGAVLFECLTGERAFNGRHALELAGQIVSYDPPTVSSLRPELRDAHDEVCRRLLAKDPRDRFDSADGLLGALQVLSTGTQQQRTNQERVPGFWQNRRMMAGIAGVLLAAVAAVLAMQWREPLSEPSDPRAAEWYRRGIEAIREGLPHSARLALHESIAAEPDYAPAFIRLAEAEIELDDADAAKQALLRVSSLVDSESRLSFEDRTRVQAVRALMLRDLDTAVRAYRTLAERHPGDPGAWLDVGRALDASGLRSDARASYEKALQLNDHYAAAHLRRGAVLGLEGRRDEALAAFDAAERLYRTAANVEGQVEALIRRGVLLNSGGELKDARAALTRAREMARTLDSRAQQIRAELTLSSVIGSEGNWTEAEKMATDAIDSALKSELESVAAEGLIELATTLQYQRKYVEADAHLVRAIALAEQRGHLTLANRATLQRASVMLDRKRFEDALSTARGPLSYFQERNFRRFELSALTILARAHEELGRYREARGLAEACLRTATAIKDEGHVAAALENLAGQANTLGMLPEALRYRRQALDIHRRQNDQTMVGYDLMNTADLLIRLGRGGEASALLDELEAGIEKKLDAFVPRARRTATLRLLNAAVSRNVPQVRARAQILLETPGDKGDTGAQLARVLVGTDRRPEAINSDFPAGSLTSSLDRELLYWSLFTELNDNPGRALAGAEMILSRNDATLAKEFEWRVAAIAAAAARQLERVDQAQVLRSRADSALQHLHRAWDEGWSSYANRPDLIELKRKAGLNGQS